MQQHNQIYLNIKMDTIFMNSENSKTFEPHLLILKLTNKLYLRIGENLGIYYTWKIMKSSYNNNKFKIPAPTWNDKFELLMDHILHQIFKTVLSIF